MTERRFKPGKSNRYKPPAGRINPGRIAWVRTFVGQFIIQRYGQDDVPEDENVHRKMEPESGDTIMLVIPATAGRPPLTFNITALTVEEFEKTRQFFNLLFELAEPVVKTRDKVAQDAFANGDDSYSRVYRSLPEFVVRQGAIREDREGVLDGSEGAAAGGGTDGDLQGRDGDGRVELADGQPTEGGIQDDGTEAY